jgi:hypothetical protein
MRCCRCKSPLINVAAMLGSYPVGPVCAKKMGLLSGKKARQRVSMPKNSPEVVIDGQMELFNSRGEI